MLVLTSCASSIKTQNSNNKSEAEIISEISTVTQKSLSGKDVSNLFCNDLTGYFNSYKYYNISTEIFYENEKQNDNATSKITKRGSLYDVEFIGVAGRYVITFSNRKFLNSEDKFRTVHIFPINHCHVMNIWYGEMFFVYKSIETINLLYLVQKL